MRVPPLLAVSLAFVLVLVALWAVGMGGPLLAAACLVGAALVVYVSGEEGDG